ncbi:MAG: LysR family substrate-binding domain-containing protein, partial [Burkholderiales bacterium]
AEEAAMAARRAARGESGRLTIGFIHAASYALLPGILRRFRERTPGIEIRLQEMTGTEQLPALLDGRIDASFLRPPVANTAIRTRVIVREPFVVALPRRHRLAVRAALGLRELSGDRFVMYAPGRSPLYGQVLGACLKAGFTPDIVQHAMHIMTLIGLVRSGVGVALLPQSASAVRMDGIVYRRLRDRGPLAQTAVAWREGDVTPVTRAFLAAAAGATPP